QLFGRGDEPAVEPAGLPRAKRGEQVGQGTGRRHQLQHFDHKRLPFSAQARQARKRSGSRGRGGSERRKRRTAGARSLGPNSSGGSTAPDGPSSVSHPQARPASSSSAPAPPSASDSSGGGSDASASTSAARATTAPSGANAARDGSRYARSMSPRRKRRCSFR